jgi:PAS domain S-box-containing protein
MTTALESAPETVVSNDRLARSILAAFDEVPDICVFVKDARRIFIGCTTPFLHLMGLSSARQLLGKRDEDLSPAHLVEQYRFDDERVLRYGEPLVGVVELVRSHEGGFSWLSTTKTPVRDINGSVSGIVGVTRKIVGRSPNAERLGGLATAIEYIYREYMRPIKVRDLASQVQMSESHFNRLFVQQFILTPYKYLMRVRISAACDLLATTDLSVGAISRRTGFYDTSHLTNEFRRARGVSPTTYRTCLRQHRETSEGVLTHRRHQLGWMAESSRG